MTPMDSIRYYKHFLRAGFMSMNPHNGHVKAYVGGPNHHYFKYDMAMVGRRQVGSTILHEHHKPQSNENNELLENVLVSYRKTPSTSLRMCSEMV